MSREVVIMGLDLSLRSAGVVVAPGSWWTFLHSIAWEPVVHRVFGSDLRLGSTEEERNERCELISSGIMELLMVHRVTHVYVEDYAFSRAQQANLGELRGVVRRAVLAYPHRHVRFRAVSQSTCRKLLLGYIPKDGRKDQSKAAVAEVLRRLGAPFETSDEADAFAVANWGALDLGLPAMTGALGPKPATPRKRRQR